jgi:L-lactate dehydrogenase complex protein LldG
MTSRDRILGRVREALRIAAPRPGAHETGAHGPRIPLAEAREWLPDGGDTVEERVARFEAASRELRTEFQWLDGEVAGVEALRALSAASAWRRVASHRTELTERFCAALGLPVAWAGDGVSARDMEPCDAGVTTCEALVAQTGGVVVTSRDSGRLLSCLPPHHVVLARREQLTGDLADAFEVLRARFGGDWPGMISFITGPSRTGDIERILVLGAHGPKRLTVLAF